MTRIPTKILVGGTALVLIVGGTAWYVAHRSGAPLAGLTASSVALPAQSPYKASGPYFKIVANYPTTTPFAAAQSQAAISAMHAWIAAEVAQFKKDGNFIALIPAKAAQQGLTAGRKYTLSIVYLEGSSAHTYSYIYTVYEDTGGAHENTFFKTFTFDASSGKLLSLSDLFTGGYLQKLSLLSQEKLTQNLGQFANASMIKSGTAPAAVSFGNWFFDNNDFVLLFPPYQVAAYAAGPQTVRIPASELSGLLKNQYP